MGISVEEILKEVANLEESINYWQNCRPDLDMVDLRRMVSELLVKLKTY